MERDDNADKADRAEQELKVMTEKLQNETQDKEMLERKVSTEAIILDIYNRAKRLESYYYRSKEAFPWVFREEGGYNPRH